MNQIILLHDDVSMFIFVFVFAGNKNCLCFRACSIFFFTPLSTIPAL